MIENRLCSMCGVVPIRQMHWLRSVYDVGSVCRVCSLSHKADGTLNEEPRISLQVDPWADEWATAAWRGREAEANAWPGQPRTTAAAERADRNARDRGAQHGGNDEWNLERVDRTIGHTSRGIPAWNEEQPMTESRIRCIVERSGAEVGRALADRWPRGPEIPRELFDAYARSHAWVDDATD